MAEPPAIHVAPSVQPQELSFPLPKNPHTTLHLHLTLLTTSIMLFLTTSTIGESAGAASPIGSFVYAMPDRTSQSKSNVISTALYTSGSSIDYATRTAKILARKAGMPVYVGCSIDFSGTTVDEEMEGLRKVVEVVMTCAKKQYSQAAAEE